MEKSIGKFIFVFLFLCGVWWEFYALNLQNKEELQYLHPVKRDILDSSEQSKFDTLFCDTLIAYLQRKEPKRVANCGDAGLSCILHFAENMPNSNKNIILLTYSLGPKELKEPPPFPDVPQREPIDSLPCDFQVRILYSKLHNTYIQISLKDLAEEKSRYNLQSFLLQNEIEVKDAKQLFYYFYSVYHNNYDFFLSDEISTCGYPHYYSIHNFNDIPISTIDVLYPKRYFAQYNIYDRYFRSKIRTTLEAYQKEANHYFCGAILKLNKSKGQWSMYLLVVNDKNPIDYKIHVFKTPPDKDYTWKGIRKMPTLSF